MGAEIGPYYMIYLLYKFQPNSDSLPCQQLIFNASVFT